MRYGELKFTFKQKNLLKDKNKKIKNPKANKLNHFLSSFLLR